MNRALRAAAVGVLLVAPVTLSACSAGQVNQTTAQSRDKVGATARIGDITLRGVELAFPRGGSYSEGSDAVLNGAIVNESASTDTLQSITGDGIAGVDVTGTGAQATFATGSAAATTDATTSSAAATSTTASTSAVTSAPGAPTSAPTSIAVPTETPSSSVGIQIPANSVIYFGQNAPHVTLTGLKQSLNAAQSLRLTFTFQRAGAVTVDVLVATPSSPIPNTSQFAFEVPTKANEPGNKVGGANPAEASSGQTG